MFFKFFYFFFFWHLLNIVKKKKKNENKKEVCNVFFVEKQVNKTSNNYLKNDCDQSNQQANVSKTISLVPSKSWNEMV